MSKPIPMTARELAEVLTGYGDLPVALGLVDGDDYASLTAFNIRQEMTVTSDGQRYLQLVGYLNDNETFNYQETSA